MTTTTIKKNIRSQTMKLQYRISTRLSRNKSLDGSDVAAWIKRSRMQQRRIRSALSLLVTRRLSTRGSKAAWLCAERRQSRNLQPPAAQCNKPADITAFDPLTLMYRVSMSACRCTIIFNRPPRSPRLQRTIFSRSRSRSGTPSSLAVMRSRSGWPVSPHPLTPPRLTRARLPVGFYLDSSVCGGDRWLRL